MAKHIMMGHGREPLIPPHASPMTAAHSLTNIYGETNNWQTSLYQWQELGF